MDKVKKLLQAGADAAGYEDRIRALEAEVQENRQLNLRLAELTDVMMEMLLPAADRDDEAVQQILARYREDAGDPLRWRPGDQAQ